MIIQTRLTVDPPLARLLAEMPRRPLTAKEKRLQAASFARQMMD